MQYLQASIREITMNITHTRTVQLRGNMWENQGSRCRIESERMRLASLDCIRSMSESGHLGSLTQEDELLLADGSNQINDFLHEHISLEMHTCGHRHSGNKLADIAVDFVLVIRTSEISYFRQNQLS